MSLAVEQVEVEAPKLLVEWSSPWEEFWTAIGPAMTRSGRPLAGEARTGLFPYRGILTSWGLEILLLAAVIVLPKQYERIRPVPVPLIPKLDVIYYSGDELPRTEDAGGARAGRSGRGGGAEAHHRTQTIRVAREEKLREKVVDAPKLDLPQSDAAVANLLAYKPIPGPVPTQGLTSSSRNPSLEAAAIAPAPQLPAVKSKVAPALQAEVVPPPVAAPVTNLSRPKLALPSDIIAPPPSQIQRQLTSRAPSTSLPNVIPPPVSAPEKDLGRKPKLALPAEVIAPPPSETTRDLASMRGLGIDLHKPVVPPPVQADEVSSSRRKAPGYGTASVVAPPVQSSGLPSSARRVAGYGSTQVVAPPVAMSGAPLPQRNLAGLGNAAVVPPPVQVNGASTTDKRVSSLGGDPSVIPPAPSVVATGRASSVGRGNHPGLPGAADVAPPPPSKEPAGTGVVVSSQPGTKVASPANSGPGSIALSPSGGAKAGIGGGGGGAGLAHGTGPGSGLASEGSGVAKEATGHGADTVAHTGNSPSSGSGGAGAGTTNTPTMPGVSVRGGSNNIITLPSFGGPSTTEDPGALGRSPSAKQPKGPAITIVATSRSGGAFNYYGALKGDRVYTIYIDTALGTAVMQFADPESSSHPYAEDLTAPQPMRADLPAGLKRSRLVIACTLDRSGTIKNTRVLEPGDAEMMAKVLAALPKWKFSPALRGDQPVEVTAILGFNIDTR